MKHTIGILFVVGYLLAAGSSFSYAQEDSLISDWHVALYDSGTQTVVIIHPDAVETIATPDCLNPNINLNYYSNWFHRKATISPDHRFLAIDTGAFPGIQVFDLENRTCFETRIDETYTGFVDVGVFNPEGSQLAFSWGPPGKLLIIDLVENPGAVLQTYDFDMGSGPLPEYWDSDGIYFFTTCYECGPATSGRLRRWNPDTGEVTATKRTFTRIVGDALALTGETLTQGNHEDYPRITYEFAYNVIEYTSGEQPGIALQVVFHDPELHDWPRPRWVLDGNAFFVRQTVVFRNGSTIPVNEEACLDITAGTPDGWLAQDEQDLYHCKIVAGEVVSVQINAAFSGPIVLLGQSPLGETATEAITPLHLASTP